MLTAVLLVFACVLAVEANKKVLVVVDDLSMESTHSMFFKTLRGKSIMFFHNFF